MRISTARIRTAWSHGRRLASTLAALTATLTYAAAGGAGGGAGGGTDELRRPWHEPDTVAAVLAHAPARGPLRVVTLQSQAGGRAPAVRVRTAADRTGAASLVQRALADPSVATVSLDSVVSALDVLVLAPPEAPWGPARLGVPSLWQAATGDGVLVAVVDTGVDAAHPALGHAVQPGLDLVDADGTGAADPHGHGTHVAGIIAAAGQTAVGLAPAARILPIRVLNAQGSGYSSTLARGIIAAADAGAQVINVSVGGPANPVLAAAVTYAASRGALVVAAGGNSRSGGSTPSFPAAYPEALAVAATTLGDLSAPYSTIGSYIDVSAPGSGIVSTVPGGGYAAMSGTSMAAPAVSASAALVLSRHRDSTLADLRRVLEGTADDLEAAGRDSATGYGLVNPAAALRWLDNPVASPTTARLTPAVSVAAAGTAVSLRVSVRTAAAGGAGVPGTTVSVCRRPVTGAVTACTLHRTDAAGQVNHVVALTTSTAVWASHAATLTTTAATSPVVRLAARPVVTLSTPARSAVAVTIKPALGQRVQVQLLSAAVSGAVWRTVATRTAPTASAGRAGSFVVPGLVCGRTYRSVVGAAGGLDGVTSASVRVR